MIVEDYLMNLKFTPSRVFAAVMLIGPSLVFAQAANNIVPPPSPPGGAVVAPPQAVSAVAPGATAPSADIAPVADSMIDLALPSAPRPVTATTPSEVVAPAPGVASAAPTQPRLNMPPVPESSLERPAPVPISVGNKRNNGTVQVEHNAFAGIVMTPVSDSQLNRFVFPEPIEGVYFSEGAPLPDCPDNAGLQDPCKPVFLNGKRMMLLQFRAGAKGPVQMLVHLQSGRIVTLNLAPGIGPGAVIRVDGAEDGASDARLRAADRGGAQVARGGMTASEKSVAMLSDFAKGVIPPGFEPESVGPAIRFEFFDVIPMAAWGDGANLRAHLFQVRAHGNQPVAINQGLFRTENVRAVALDRDTITYDEPAMLYVLEHLPEIE